MVILEGYWSTDGHPIPDADRNANIHNYEDTKYRKPNVDLALGIL
jgi:hypothetical protein